MVDGLAVHWYADDNASPTILSEAHAKLNGKWMLYTEVFGKKYKRKEKI